MSDIKVLKEEYKRLRIVEEKLLEFILAEEEYAHLAIKQLFQVATLILEMQTILEEVKRRNNDDSTEDKWRNKKPNRASL